MSSSPELCCLSFFGILFCETPRLPIRENPKYCDSTIAIIEQQRVMSVTRGDLSDWRPFTQHPSEKVCPMYSMVYNQD